jgi:CheY-like chemotaxis protein
MQGLYTEPLYMRLANSLKDKIVAGTYQRGERLPRQHDLAKEQGVAFNTLRKALDLLEGEGYVVRKVGQGTYARLPQNYLLTALVVDDEESIRSLLTTALVDSGWHCVAVESGELALDEFREQRFDVIFLDLIMPGLNGAETLREIRALDPEAAVVVITGYPDSAIMAEALQVGPFAVMRKPFTIVELGVVLVHVANRSQTAGSRSK